LLAIEKERRVGGVAVAGSLAQPVSLEQPQGYQPVEEVIHRSRAQAQALGDLSPAECPRTEQGEQAQLDGRQQCL